MIKNTLYREVFNTPAGKQVFADICGYVERMNVSEPGSAGKLIAHIARMKDMPDAAPAEARTLRTAGGRIAHG